jgi:hypothetical protein
MKDHRASLVDYKPDIASGGPPAATEISHQVYTGSVGLKVKKDGKLPYRADALSW